VKYDAEGLEEVAVGVDLAADGGAVGAEPGEERGAGGGGDEEARVGVGLEAGRGEERAEARHALVRGLVGEAAAGARGGVEDEDAVGVGDLDGAAVGEGGEALPGEVHEARVEDDDVVAALDKHAGGGVQVAQHGEAHLQHGARGDWADRQRSEDLATHTVVRSPLAVATGVNQQDP
jgi:hypothetical protein